MLLAQGEGETRALVHRALMPCWGAGSGRAHQGSWCPCWSFCTGSHGAGGSGDRSQGLPSTVVQVVHVSVRRVPFLSYCEWVLWVVQHPTYRRVCEALASLSFNREKLDDQKSTLPSLTAAWRLALNPLCSQPLASFLLLWGPNHYSENKSRLRRNIISYYYYDLTQDEEARGEPCPCVQGTSALWLNLRLSTHLPARAVLPQALAQVYWCLELF